LRFAIGIALFLGCGENWWLGVVLNVKVQPTGRLGNEFVVGRTFSFAGLGSPGGRNSEAEQETG